LSEERFDKADFADVYWRHLAPADFDLPDFAAPSRPNEIDLRLLADSLPPLCWIADGDGSADVCGTGYEPRAELGR
jgi:hypothetical protein